MAITVAELVAKVVADTDAASRGLQGFGTQARQTGQAFSLGLTLPIVGAGTAIVKTSLDFDTSLRRVVGLTDVTQDQIAGIRDRILELGGEVGKTPQELADAFYFLASAGFNGDEALRVLETSAKASASGLGETQDVARVLGATINAYGHDNISAASAADILTQAVKDGTAEASEFASSLQYVIPTAAAMGVEFDQLTAAVAGMTLGGTDASTATTNLNQVFTSLLKPTKEATDTLKDLGLSAGGIRQELKEKGLLATLETLRGAFKGNDVAAAKVFGNVRALRGVLGLLNLDADQLHKVFGDTADATGTLAGAFSDTEGPARDFGRAQADLDATMIDIGNTVLPIVVEAMKGLRGALAAVTGWWDSLDQGTRNFIVTAAGIVAAVGPALIILGTLATLLGALLSPIGLVVVAVTALAAAWATNFGGIRDIAMTVGNALANSAMFVHGVITTVWTAITTAIGNAVTFIGQVPGQIGAFLGQLVQGVLTFGQNIINAVTHAFSEFAKKPGYYIGRIVTALPLLLAKLVVIMAQGFAKMVTVAVDWLIKLPGRVADIGRSVIANVATWMGNLASRAATGAANVVSRVVDFFAKLPGRVVDAVRWLIPQLGNFLFHLPGQIWSRLLAVGKSIVEGIWRGISGLGGWLWDQVTGFFGGIVDNIKNFFGIGSPSKLFAEIGGNLMKGIGVGFEHASLGVAKAMSDTARGLVPGVTAPQPGALGPQTAISGSAGGGNTTVILYADRYMGTQAEADYYAGMVARNLQFQRRQM